jgi:hypothetical protein
MMGLDSGASRHWQPERQGGLFDDAYRAAVMLSAVIAIKNRPGACARHYRQSTNSPMMHSDGE